MSAYNGHYTHKPKRPEYIITKDSGQIMGNNPYSMNRTTIDPSFRACKTSKIPLSQIEGYDARGCIIYRGAEENPFVDHLTEDRYDNTYNNPVDQDNIFPEYSPWNEETPVQDWSPVPNTTSIAMFNKIKEQEIMNQYSGLKQTHHK